MQKKDTRGKFLTPAFAIAVSAIAAAAVMLCVCGPVWFGQQKAEENISGVSPDPSQTSARADESSSGPLPNVVLPGWSMITVDADEQQINDGIDLYNPEENEGYYNLAFEILVDTDGSGNYRSLYQSGLVEPGNHIYSVKLSEPLKQGIYNARIFMQPYDISGRREGLNNGAVDLQITAE